MRPHGHKGFYMYVCAYFSLLLSPSRAYVVVYSENGTGATPLAYRFEDIPASETLGSRIPNEGFSGRLQLAKPDIFACTALEPNLDKPGVDSLEEQGLSAETTTPSTSQSRSTGNHGLDDPNRFQNSVGQYRSTHTNGTSADDMRVMVRGQPFALLISRSLKDDPRRCTFEQKAVNAEAAGAALAIIYDYKEGQLFQMGISDEDHVHPTISIPLVLVSQESGLVLQGLISASKDPYGPQVGVDNYNRMSGMNINPRVIFLISIILMTLFTCGGLVLMTIHGYLRRYESLLGSAHRPMNLTDVMRLPEVEVTPTSKYEGEKCPVCLDTYLLGNKLRGLPCGHVFHGGCITPWLTERQRTCPMCKERVEIRADSAASTAEHDSPEGTEIPPLARSMSSVVNRNTSPSGANLGRAGIAERRSRDEVVRRSGDRLPLLQNLRGQPRDGGSMDGMNSPV